MADAFIKFMRSESVEALQSKPIANHVLSVIAQRARRTPHPTNGLQPGDCFMGDYLTIGISRQAYRTAISNLQKWGYITIHPTNKGTVVTLSNTMVYDINTENQPTDQPANNQQPNQQPTNKQPTAQPLTKNDKNGKNETMKECKKEYSDLFIEFWSVYPKGRKSDKPGCYAIFKKQPHQTQLDIIEHVRLRATCDAQWLEGYIPLSKTFMNNNRWTDEYRVNELSGFSDKAQESIRNIRDYIDEHPNTG